MGGLNAGKETKEKGKLNQYQAVFKMAAGRLSVALRGQSKNRGKA